MLVANVLIAFSLNLLCAIYFCDFITVIILQFLESSTEPEVKYQRIIHKVKEFIHQKNFPQHLQDKLISYYEYRYQDGFFKENVISDTLSSELSYSKIR